MKRKILSFIMAILCLTMIVGCTGGLVGGPKTSDPVTNNGGLVVQKGDWIYFVNGYLSISDMSASDNQGGAVNSAVYRAKLGEDKKLSYDEDGNLENCERVIDKVAGFEKAGLFIFGDYLYFATPNTDKVVSEGSMQDNFKYTDFCRVNLNGTGLEYIYKSTVESDSTVYSFYKINGTVYLALYNGTDLIIVNCSNKNAKTVATGVTSVALPNVSEHSETYTMSEQEKYVYYSRSGTEEEELLAGNILAKAKISNGNEIVLKQDNTNTYTVASVTNEALFYTKKSQTGANAYHYFSKFTDGEVDFTDENDGLNNGKTKQLTFSSHTGSIFIPDFENGYDRGIITTNTNGYLIRITSDGSKSTTEILDETQKLTPVSVVDDFVFAYNESGELFRINYKTNNTLTLTTEDTKMYTAGTKKFTYCDGVIYFFGEFTGETDTGIYLNRIDTRFGDYTINIVGVLQENHKVVEEE